MVVVVGLPSATPEHDTPPGLFCGIFPLFPAVINMDMSLPDPGIRHDRTHVAQIVGTLVWNSLCVYAVQGFGFWAGSGSENGCYFAL